MAESFFTPVTQVHLDARTVSSPYLAICMAQSLRSMGLIDSEVFTLFSRYKHDIVHVSADSKIGSCLKT